MSTLPPSQPPPPYSYTPPPGAPPNPPNKTSRTILYVVLGLLGVCILCGVVAAVLFAVRMPSIINGVSQQVIDITTQVATEMPSISETTVPAGIVKKVTMARGVQGATMDPTDPTMVFNPGDTFHAVASIQNAPDGTKFEAEWFAEDVGSAAAPNTRIDGNELVAGGNRNLDFSLKPESNWPAGKYRVEISVEGHLEQTVHFTVQ